MTTNPQFLARCAVEDLADAEKSLERARADLRDAKAAVRRAHAARRHALDRAARSCADAINAQALTDAMMDVP